MSASEIEAQVQGAAKGRAETPAGERSGASRGGCVPERVTGIAAAAGGETGE